MCQDKSTGLLLSFAISDRIEKVKAINNGVWGFTEGDPVMDVRAQRGKLKGKGQCGWDS